MRLEIVGFDDEPVHELRYLNAALATTAAGQILNVDARVIVLVAARP